MKRRAFILNAAGILVPIGLGLMAAPPPGGGGRLANGRSFPAPAGGGGGGGGGCTTAQTTKNAATSSQTELGGSRYIGSRFSAGASFTACKAVLRLGVTGASYTIRVGIFSNGGSNLPGSLIGSYSDTVNANTVGAAEGDITFVNMSASIVSGTTYHIVAQCSSDFNSPNCQWAAMGEAITNGVTASSDGSAWSSVDDFSVQKYILYS